MATAALSGCQLVLLNDGYKIPNLGLGTYMADGKDCAVAMKCGYRMLDTATLYTNEIGIGKAIAESGLSRSDIFITTKVWDSDHGRSKTKAAFEASLRRWGIAVSRD